MSIRRSTAIASVVLFSLVPVACGSSGSGTKPGDPTTTSADSTGSSDAPGTTAVAGNPGDEKLVESAAAADKTIAYTTDGGFEPSSLHVAPGEVFTITAGADENAFAVTFNGNDSYTVTSGMSESFTLQTSGTYTMKEFVNGEKSLTIIVG